MLIKVSDKLGLPNALYEVLALERCPKDIKMLLANGTQISVTGDTTIELFTPRGWEVL